MGEEALAAIGASYALTNVFICIAIGGGVGAGVLTGRYFGAREYGKLRLCVRTALLAFLFLSLLLAAFGLFFCMSILQTLHTPENVLSMAFAYLQIYFLGLPFLFLYNVLSAMFNALGRSRVPLYLLLSSSTMNIPAPVAGLWSGAWHRRGRLGHIGCAGRVCSSVLRLVPPDAEAMYHFKSPYGFLR
ncbi:MAG: MATE family efflux transporter [Eubacteriales bacterium]